MAKNKPINLNVGGFMLGIKNNQPSEKKETNVQTEDKVLSEETNVESVAENNAVTEEMKNEQPDEVQKESGKIEDDSENGSPINEEPNEAKKEKSDSNEVEKMPRAKRQAGGRPQKITKRDQKQAFRLDADSYTNLMLIKTFNRIDIQDVVFTALVDFLDKNFNSRKGLNKEAVELVKKTLGKYDV